MRAINCYYLSTVVTEGGRGSEQSELVPTQDALRAAVSHTVLLHVLQLVHQVAETTTTTQALLVVEGVPSRCVPCDGGSAQHAAGHPIPSQFNMPVYNNITGTSITGTGSHMTRIHAWGRKYLPFKGQFRYHS